MQKQPDFFTQEERTAINNVATQLNLIDASQSKELPGQFREIIKIFEEVRAGIIQVTGKETLTETTLEIDLNLNPPEIRFKVTNKPNRFWQKFIGKKAAIEILILANTGYTTTSPERLSSPGNHRLAQYRTSSFTNLREFFRKILDPK